MRRAARRWVLGILVLLAALVEALTPAGRFAQPVGGAGRADWNPRTFWHAPWGKSGVHKGLDIFARRGAPVVTAQSGWVIYAGTLEQGGKVVLTITPRGWLHYHAHLSDITVRPGRWLPAGTLIGRVGDSGNAAGKPPHLHYSVLTLVPRPWDIRWTTKGWQRMFYRDPGALLPG